MLLWRVSAVVSRAVAAGWGSTIAVRRRAAVLRPSALPSLPSRRAHSVSSTGGSDARPATAAAADAGSSPGPYRDSVLLPRTDFPTKLTGQKLLERELEIQRVRR